MLWRRCFWRRTLSTLLNWSADRSKLRINSRWPMTWSPSCWYWWDSYVFVFLKKGLGELVERNLALKCFTLNVYCVEKCGPNPSSHWAIPKLSSSTWELLGKKDSSITCWCLVYCCLCHCIKWIGYSFNGVPNYFFLRKLTIPRKSRERYQNYTGLPSPKEKNIHHLCNVSKSYYI